MNYFNDLFPVMPELILAALALVIVSSDLFLPRDAKWVLTPITIGGLILVGVSIPVVWDAPGSLVFSGFYQVDNLSLFIKGVALMIGILTALFGPSYLRVRRLPLGEFNAILVFALLGLFALASASDLITLFVGLELMVMPGYILTGFHKTDRYSNEGGLKYFLLGSFASAILLFGISWTFGLTGTTHLSGIAQALGSAKVSPGLLVAIGFLTVGATFKAAAVPFHYWTPDAYQGAPTPITGFLSVGPKLGAFALLIRIFVYGLGTIRADWLAVMAVLAVLTMTGGNIVALTQSNVKRMLAYSSIAHTGYILAGLAAFAAAGSGKVATQGIQSVLFYLLGYSVMNIAAFAVVGQLQRDTHRYGGIGSFAGLARRDPWRAAGMAILLLSLTGIPPTVGFFAKLYVLIATVDAGLGWLAVVIVLNAALAAFYYLRIVVTMYMREPEEDPAPIDNAAAGNLGLVLAVAGVLVLGLFPDTILTLLQRTLGTLF